MCSTPFGITARGTEGALAGLRRDVGVNAFRHHGQGNPRRAAHSYPPGHVLNAFRHHGQGNSAGAVQGHLFVACSTPFGITARGTHPTPASLPAGTACSTPFGITARGTSCPDSFPQSQEEIGRAACRERVRDCGDGRSV